MGHTKTHTQNGSVKDYKGVEVSEALILTGQVVVMLLHALRTNVPADFEYWLTIGSGEMRCGWIAKKEDWQDYQPELRADGPVQLVEKISELDWAVERLRAREGAQLYKNLRQ